MQYNHRLSYFELFVCRIPIHMCLVFICNMAEFPLTCEAVNSSRYVLLCANGRPRRDRQRKKRDERPRFSSSLPPQNAARPPCSPRSPRRYPGRPSQLVCPAPMTSHSFPLPVIYGLLCWCSRTCVRVCVCLAAPSSSPAWVSALSGLVMLCHTMGWSS